MIIKKIVKFLAAAAACVALHHFCEDKTRGFRPYLILSNLPSDPRWEMPPLSESEEQQIHTLLDQPFTFLGSGGWCYAFLGQDQKTVLKFYKHTHLKLFEIMKAFSFEKLLLKSPLLRPGASYFQEFNFISCACMHARVKQRTGLLYVHLNKTEGLHKSVTLIDNIGVKHTIDLNKTEFIVQKKADLLIPHLEELIQKNKIEEAKLCLDEIISCLCDIYKSGLKDLDTSFRNNYGFTEDGAVALDLSSFAPVDSISCKNEVVLKTKRLSRYLRKKHLELSLHFEEKLSQILEEKTE